MTLTQAATLTRRGILITGISIFILVSSWVGYDMYRHYQLSQLPPPEEKAENKFGSLPEINFPTSTVSSSNFSYSVDTPTGELPSFPKLMKVYFIPKAGITLLAPDKARALATKFEMENGPQTTATDQYMFTDDQNGKLIIDIQSGNFYLEKSATPSGDLADLTLPEEQQLVETFKRHLSTKIEVPPQLHNGRGKAMVTPAVPSQPPMATVSLWVEDLDKTPIVTAKYNQGLVTADILPNQDKTLLFTKINYVFWPVDITTYSTYQIKSTEQALDDLKSGRGFVSVIPQSPQVSITSVTLAYHQSEAYTPYLQPVFVFEGPNFVALVPAIQKN